MSQNGSSEETLSALKATDTIKKGRWNKDENKNLKLAVKKLGTSDWIMISRLVPGRSNKQCRQRYFYSLSPQARRHDAWSESEDWRLFLGWRLYGNNWKRIATFNLGRTNRHIKNRFRVFVKKNLEHFQSQLESAREMFATDYDKFSNSFTETEKQLLLANFSKPTEFLDMPPPRPGRQAKAPNKGLFRPKDLQYLTMIKDTYRPESKGTFSQSVILEGNSFIPVTLADLNNRKKVEMWESILQSNLLNLGQLKKLNRNLNSIMVQNDLLCERNNFSFMENWSKKSRLADSKCRCRDQDWQPNAAQKRWEKRMSCSLQELPLANPHEAFGQALSVDGFLGKRSEKMLLKNMSNNPLTRNQKTFSLNEKCESRVPKLDLGFNLASQSTESLLNCLNQATEYRNRLKKLYSIKRDLFQKSNLQRSSANRKSEKAVSDDPKDLEEHKESFESNEAGNSSNFISQNANLNKSLCSLDSELRNDFKDRESQVDLPLKKEKMFRHRKKTNLSYLTLKKNFIEPDFNQIESPENLFEKNCSIELALSKGGLKLDTRACTSPNPELPCVSCRDLTPNHSILSPESYHFNFQPFSEINLKHWSQNSDFQNHNHDSGCHRNKRELRFQAVFDCSKFQSTL